MRQTILTLLILVLGLSSWCTWAQNIPVDPNIAPQPAQAVLISCEGMIDNGLYESIKRRSNEAIEQGADYIILEVSTYGGLLEAADNIAKLLILDLSPKVRTVAYIVTEAISAGALISVSCQDIIMRENTTIGDCAPIVMGGKLEGVEREKSESFTRAAFDRAAKANDYPQALLRAMVTMQVEVYRIRNLLTDANDYFEASDVPTDANAYDLESKELVINNERILTVDAATALDYGIARANVADREGALDYLAQRDGVTFKPLQVLKTNWSEELVRKIQHPAVMGILVMVALMGLYMEFSTPGLGLPGLAAAISLVIIIGSKFIIGMANWVEVAVFVVGIILVLIEFLIIPGFGLAGIAGILCIFGGLFGMLVRNPPDRLPWPTGDMDWQLFTEGLYGLVLGLLGFVVLAVLLARYLPKLKIFSGLILVPNAGMSAGQTPLASSVPASDGPVQIHVGAIGTAVSPLHPAGRVRFDDHLVDCVTQAEFLAANTQVVVTEIHGNRVVVEQIKTTE
ncbi:nodulation protein NfeD [Planctomycetota bacterium]